MSDRDSIRSRRRTLSQQRASARSEESDQSDDQSGQSKVSGSDGVDTTATLEPLTEASAKDWLGSNQDPDVMLSVPNLGVDRIKLTVDNVKADVELHARILDLVELHVGAKVSIDKVDLEIDNVRVQAMLKVKLDKVEAIVDRLLTTIDNHPEILSDLTGGIGRGVENALSGDQSSQQRELSSGSSEHVSQDTNQEDQQ